MSRGRSSPTTVWLVLLIGALLSAIPLPASIEPFRPPWVTMAIAYWAMMWPRTCGIVMAWIIGVVLDVMQGSLLGQHALSLSVVAYFTLRFHLQIRNFPLWQITMTVFALLAIDAFIVFWIDGIAGVPTGGPVRWTPAVAGAVVWPPVMAIFDRLRLGAENRGKSYV
jgi:rod shape-determining protein MreD